MRQLSLRSPKGADTEGAGWISKAPDRAAHPWTVLRKQDRLGTRAQIRLVASFFSVQLGIAMLSDGSPPRLLISVGGQLRCGNS